MTLLHGGVRAAPSTIAGIVAWWDAGYQVFKDAGVTPCAVGDAVQQWNDLVNTNNLIQTTGANQPKYQTRGPKNVVRFDGSASYMAAASNSTLNLANVFTIFVVCSESTLFVDTTILTKQTGGYQARIAGSGKFQLWKDLTGAINDETLIIGQNAYYRVTMRRNGNASNSILINKDDKSGVINNPWTCVDNSSDLWVGHSVSPGPGAEWFPGDILAICLFNTSISDADAKTLNDYYLL